ncbi:uncharacterized protein ACA1_068020 [Acanthamoeba castellanii str. Neff]|uniref:Uncharacterized protein n=1 Tax=Acanthamoeba castellanii (strain ATCC 30010 / Neff) TaxID=1257118 RepID=L8HEM1_ACACF|nr:uncharacterized protein ACA1_068020 [Acanthamoeba castellanii str. Neff]ELR23218.1 hypothetical protein ACA1_068020 [Acanthamoeba castellanii str. Neff]
MSEPSAELELGMEIEPVIEESKDLPNQGKSCGSIEEEESTTQPAPTISIEAENCSGDTEEAIRTEADYVTVEQPIAFDGELEDHVELRAGSVREADKVQEEIAAAFGEITVETPNTTINNDKEKKTDEEKLEEEHEKQESSGEGMQNEHTIEEKTTEENEERKEESDKDRMDIEVAPQGEEEANESISSLIEESEKEEREAEENDQREDTTDQRVQEDQTEREMKVEKEEVPCASVDASSSFDVWLRTEVLPLDDTRPSPTTRPNDPLASVTIDRPASPGGAEEHDAWQRLLRQLRQRASEGRGTTAEVEAERAPAFDGCTLPAAEGSEPQFACGGRKRGLAELAVTGEGRETRPGTPPGSPPRKKAFEVFKEPADVDAVVATGIPMKLFDKPRPPLPYASKSFCSAVGRKRKRVQILHPNAQQPKAKPLAMLDPFATNEWEE